MYTKSRISALSNKYGRRKSPRTRRGVVEGRLIVPQQSKKLWMPNRVVSPYTSGPESYLSETTIDRQLMKISIGKHKYSRPLGPQCHCSSNNPTAFPSTVMHGHHAA